MAQTLWTIIYVFWALIGLCIGSYLNVVIYRVPLKMSTAFPPSHCPNCNERIRWYDNIPVLSYLLLGRKCRYCRQPISPRYMLVELANMLLWLGCALLYAPDALPTAVISSIACSVLLCVAFIDLEHMFIPDRFQVLLAVLGVAALVASLWYPDGVLWWERMIGMAAGGGGFGLIYLAFLWIRKKEGMGIGDIKLVAAAGLLLGPWNLLIAVFAASLSASVILIIVQHRQGEGQKEYPFAPFIAAGVIMALLFGQSIQSAYLGLFL